MGVDVGVGEVYTGDRSPSEVLLQRQVLELVDACAWMDGWMDGWMG